MKKIRKFILRVFFPKRYYEKFVYPVIEKSIRNLIELGILTEVNPYANKTSYWLYLRKTVKEQMQNNEVV